MPENENNIPSDEELSKIIAELVELGAIEILGYDSVSDQFTYKITEKCKEIYPALYNEHFKTVNGIAKDLWMRDIIDIVFMDGQTVVGLTKEQFEYVQKNILDFEEEERFFLESILSYYQDKNGV